MLYRSKCINFFAERKNDDATRMLSGRTPDACTSFRYPHYLAVSLGNLAFLKVFADIAICRLIRYSAYSSRFKGLTFSEDNFCVRVSLRLILSGKVKINIRLLISFKSEEGLKWYIKALFRKRLAATLDRYGQAYRIPHLRQTFLHLPNQNHSNGNPHSCTDNVAEGDLLP